MKTSLKALACMTALGFLLTVQPAAAKDKLQGVWKFTQVTLPGPNPQTLTLPEPGIFMFTKKHSSFVFCGDMKPRIALPETGATDAQRLATWSQFFASAATYEIKGTTITAHPIIGKEPVKAGFSTTVDFKFEGNTLLLMPTIMPDGRPLPKGFTLKLARVE